MAQDFGFDALPAVLPFFLAIFGKTLFGPFSRQFYMHLMPHVKRINLYLFGLYLTHFRPFQDILRGFDDPYKNQLTVLQLSK